MGSERGSAALAVVGAVALSTLVGFGAYVVIKDRRLAADATEIPVAAAAPSPVEPRPAVEPAAPEPTPPTPQPSEPVDVADASALDPDVGSEPPTTNAPMFGTPGIAGQVDPEGVASAVRGASGRLQRCFETRLGAGARISGTLRVRLEINRRGGVTTATAAGVDDELATCVAAVMRDVRVPRTTDGGTATIVVPIAFHEAKPEQIDSVSRQELGEALAALRLEVIACANREGFVGMTRVKFTVLPSGTVGDVTIPDVEPTLAKCVTRAFKARTFTATMSGVTATFPFRVAGE